MVLQVYKPVVNRDSGQSQALMIKGFSPQQLPNSIQAGLDWCLQAHDKWCQWAMGNGQRPEPLGHAQTSSTCHIHPSCLSSYPLPRLWNLTASCASHSPSNSTSRGSSTEYLLRITRYRKLFSSLAPLVLSSPPLVGSFAPLATCCRSSPSGSVDCGTEHSEVRTQDS